MAELTAMRITSFEVANVDGDWGETTKRWHQLSDQCKGVANCFWETWLVWHVTEQSRKKMIQWLEKRKVKGIKAAGKCPVDVMPKPLNSRINAVCKECYSELHSRVRTLVINTINRDLFKHKAATGNLKMHTSILLHNQSVPSSTRAHPIPFDRQNCKLLWPEKGEENILLQLRIGRIDRGSKPGIGIQETLELRCKGQRVQSQVAILKRIMRGDYAFRGSSLVYSKAKRKWFAQIAFRMPIEPRTDLDAKKTAVLLARRGWPWTLLTPAGRKMPGGRGRYVAPVRRSLLLQRWDRQGNYRYAGSASKGHGRQRATRDQWQLQKRWRDFTKRAICGWVNIVAEWCIATGCGKLIYIQPHGSQGETRFLHNAGKVGNRRDSTGWPWFDVGTRLKYVCQKNGIELVILKPASVRNAGKKLPKKKAGK